MPNVFLPTPHLTVLCCMVGGSGEKLLLGGGVARWIPHDAATDVQSGAIYGIKQWR